MSLAKVLRRSPRLATTPRCNRPSVSSDRGAFSWSPTQADSDGVEDRHMRPVGYRHLWVPHCFLRSLDSDNKTSLRVQRSPNKLTVKKLKVAPVSGT
jgi:hypothetical protein